MLVKMGINNITICPNSNITTYKVSARCLSIWITRKIKN